MTCAGLALIGAKRNGTKSLASPATNHPLARLGRPRVDVTRAFRFFRDAFPAQITLFDRAIRRRRAR
jgi:cobaltochelatase CobN